MLQRTRRIADQIQTGSYARQVGLTLYQIRPNAALAQCPGQGQAGNPAADDQNVHWISHDEASLLPCLMPIGRGSIVTT